MLETGSTPLIRNTAAQQLGDVQKQHPDELFNLLGRILPYLKSKSWDTRTAAAKAIGLIVTNADIFDPNEEDGLGIKKADDEDDLAVEIKSEEAQLSPSDELLQLESLDLTSILKYGKRLLGSAGKEYEYSLAAMDPISRLQHQKKTLNSRLGLAGEYIEDDLIDDTDLALKTPAIKEDPSHAAVSRENSHQLSAPVTTPSEPANGEESGLSKRQLNQLKRKNKQSAKMGANKVRVVDLSARKTSDVTTPSVTTPHPIKAENGEERNGDSKSDYFSLERPSGDDDSKIVSEFKGEAAPEKPLIQPESSDEGPSIAWPYEPMCDFLMVDLFDPNWEVRHGAAMALREVIRVQGAGAGRLRGKSRSENDTLNRKWLDDLACRLICVLMLDRFGDYISDNVVAPIRETVGQTLGALLSQLPSRSVIAVYRCLYRHGKLPK